MTVLPNPKIVHIVHVDRLQSIINDGCLWCDSTVIRRSSPGSTIGMNQIKQRRLSTALRSYSELRVGDCVPFYFSPRSVMLYVISRRNNPEMAYGGGQEPIVHLVADLLQTVEWAENEKLRWAFTLSNAGALYFEDRCKLEDLKDIDWKAVHARDWRDQLVKENKQAEFLVESRFAWQLISHIGVMTNAVRLQVVSALADSDHQPRVELKRNWYY